MRKIILIMIATIFLVSLVSAEPAFIFKQHDNINFSINAFESDNSKATATTSCYLTVKNPENEVIINDQAMDFNTGGFYSFALNSTHTTDNGEYPCSVRCDDGSEYGFSSFDFEVTPSGTNLSTSGGIVYIVVFILSIGMFLTALIASLKIKWGHSRDEEGVIMTINELRWTKPLAIFATYMILTWIFFMARGITRNFLHFDMAYNFFHLAYIVMISFMFPILIVSILFTIFAVVRNKKLWKMMHRGFNVK